MKKIFILVYSFLALNLSAQISKTVNCSAGSLAKLLLTSEKNTITNLTITGIMDARDFQTLRDSMPVLSEIDMSTVSIVKYQGDYGTFWVYGGTYSYEPNEIPISAFCKSWKLFDGGMKSLTKIILPNSISSIAGGAFSDCTNLTTTYIYASILSIADNAFSSSNVLVDSNNPNYSSIDGVLFNKSKTNLIRYPHNRKGDYTIPTGVETISDYAFYETDSLTSIQFPSTLKDIGVYAFHGCVGLTAITIPSGITEIKRETFGYCTNIESVILPPTITKIGYSAFSSCYKLLSINFPSSIDTIDDFAFDNCKLLQSINLPSSLKHIGDFAFNYCQNIVDPVIIPSKTKKIGAAAFSDCIKLTSINIPSSVEYIGNSAFENCTGLKNIQSNLLDPYDFTVYNDSNVFKGVNTGICTLNVPTGMKAKYSNAFIWKDFPLIKEQTIYEAYSKDLTSTLYDTTGSYITIPVISNTPWTATVDQLWVTISKTTDSSIILTAIVNRGDNRFANLTISGVGSVTNNYTVTQNKFNPYLYLYVSKIPLSDSAGSTTTIRVRTNTIWSITNNQPWMTVTQSTSDGNGTITCVANQNISTSSRYNGFRVTGQGYSQQYVAIWQNEAKSYLTISKNDVSIPAVPTSFDTITVNANYSWSIKSDQSWLSWYYISTTQFRFNVENNTTISPRTGTLTITSSNAIPQVITVTQAAGNPYLNCTTTLKDVSHDAIKDSITVSSNTTWQAASDQSWMTVNPISNTGNGKLYLQISSNTGIARIATITLSAVGCDNKYITIIQSDVTGESSKTINSIAGSLQTSFTTLEKHSLTSLTINGFIDARDFKFIRDSLKYLTSLDLRMATIDSYEGTEGPNLTDKNIMLYPSNTIPRNAFTNKNNLLSVQLPTSITAIGIGAFEHCGITSIELPQTVTIIDDYAFSECSLYSIEFPKNLKTIGNYAFKFCGFLKSVIIPETVTNIGYDAFAYCLKLENITFPSKIQSIPSEICFDCTMLQSIDIPQSVRYIGSGAFSGCNSLKSLIIPASVQEIGGGAFKYCDSIVSIYACNPVPVDLSMAPDAFGKLNISCDLYVDPYSYNNYNKAVVWKDFWPFKIMEMSVSNYQVTITDTITKSIGINVYANVQWSASSNQSWITLNPDSKVLGNSQLLISAIDNTDEERAAMITITGVGVKPITIIVKQINKSLYRKTVKISAGLLGSTLSKQDLDSISELAIKGTIDARDFRVMRDSMPNLKKIDLSKAKVLAYEGYSGTLPFDFEKKIYLANTIPANAFYKVWSDTMLTSIILSDSIVSIDELAFNNCSNLQSVTFPAELRNIGNMAFNQCQKLSSIKLPAKLERIDSYAFENCESIDSLYISSTVSYIDEKALLSCSGYVNVDKSNQYFSSKDGVLFNKNQSILLHCPNLKLGIYIVPTTVDTIGNYAFSNCLNLLDVTLPQTLKSIGEGAFEYCQAIKTFTIPSNVRTVGASSFSSCITLDSISILSPLTEIADYTFYNCTSLNKISLPQTVKSIGLNAFYSCSNLESIMLPDSLLSIDEQAFSSCYKLKNITFNSLLKNIGNSAFSGCSFDSLTIPSLVTNLSNGLFSGCSHLTKVVIPSNVTFIGHAAFAGCKALKQIYSFSKQPADLTNYYNVFVEVDTTTCILYVPIGSKSLYQNAVQWKSFVHIVEMDSSNLSLSISTISLTQSSNIDTIKINSNSYWTVSSDVSWITFSPISGNGNGNITLLSTTNPTTIARTATITITTGDGNTKTITLTQAAGNSIISIQDSSVLLSNSNASSTFDLISNTDWTILSDVSWLNISPSNGSSNATVSISPIPNPTTSARTATLTIKTADGTVKTIDINQAGADPIITLNQTNIIFTEGVSADTIIIQSNGPWSAASDVSWLTISPASGTGNDTVVVTASPNTSTIARTANITITSEAPVILKTSISQTITVTQAAAKTFVENIENEQVSIYPNPATNFISIKSIGKASIQIYSIDGIKLIDCVGNSGQTISVDALSKGIYVVKIKTDSKLFEQKLIIE